MIYELIATLAVPEVEKIGIQIYHI